jgi:multidrug resistance efflux pump
MSTGLSVLPRIFLTAIALAVAVPVGMGLWEHYAEAPWTRDGHIRADVVAVAPDVSGLIKEVLVHDNRKVHKGDVLLRIDPERFSLALKQAEAVLASREAAVERATSDRARYEKLSDAAVTQQQRELVRATDLQAKAAYDQAVADVEVARLNLARSEICAPVNGRITNFELQPGSYVSAGRGVMALIDDDTLRVEGYFEETKLPRIRVGSRASVKLMGGETLTGKVESIAGGIEDRERSEGSSLLANINPTFSWVRLAQRIPVRIKLNATRDSESLIIGRTVTVSINDSRDPEATTLSRFGENIARLLRASS